MKHNGPLSLGFSDRSGPGNVFDCAGRHPYTAAQDSNIARKKVTRERDTKLLKPHRAFARVLSFLLLGFIVYGTTVEAAHTHGSLPGPNTIAGASSFSDPATETKAGTNLLGCGDCLICQLHQHFSASLISAPPSISASSLKSLFFNLTTVSVHSQTSTPQTGRAPPPATC
jgi:hypothetical protein